MNIPGSEKVKMIEPEKLRGNIFSGHNKLTGTRLVIPPGTIRKMNKTNEITVFR